MSNTNQVKLTLGAEDSFAVDPHASPADGTVLRFTGETLHQEAESQVSGEIISDRQVSGVVRTNVSAAGAINFEFSYGTYDDLIVAMLQSAGWAALDTTTVSTIDFAAPSGSTQVVSDSGSGFGGLAVNQWVRIAGATNATNNGLFKITVASAASITILNSAGVVESVGASITVLQGSQIVNGTTYSSFVVEKEFTDLSNIFNVVRGLSPNQMALSLPESGLISGSFEFLGKVLEDTAATVFGGTVSAASTTDGMNTIDNVSAIFENGVSIGVVSMDMSVSNNLRNRSQIAELGPIGIGSGSFVVSGSMRLYFEDNTLLAKFLDWTSSSLSVKFVDGAGNQYIFDFPSVKFTANQANATGQNQDVVQEVQFQAVKDSTEGITMRVQRFGA